MIPVCEPSIGKEEFKNVVDCIKTGWISSKGKYVDEFEGRFARYCGAKFGISTINGTTALHLALASLNIKTGDEVIVPTFTMIATVNAIIYTGATPVLVDSEPKTWNIDTNKIEEKITEKTKAILPVHIYGHPCDMDKILEIADRHDLYVIEDAAEACGAKYKDKIVGCLGDIGCFSFYANKIITTGEGGMIVTNNERIAEMARSLKNHAFDKERSFLHQTIGFNYRMTNIQAAIGLAQLEKIDTFIKKKRNMGRFYDSLLKDIPGISLQKHEDWANSVYWMYPILIEDDFGMGRDSVKKELWEKGIDTRLLFAPMHTQPAYKNIKFNGEYPVSEELYKRGFYLPSSVKLTESQIRFIVNSIKGLQR